MAAPTSAQTRSQAYSPAWYIHASGRVWGPYPYSRMAEFVGEGRLSPSSLVGSQPAGPFGAAERRPELLDLFAPPMPGAPAPTRQPVEPQRPIDRSPASPGARVAEPTNFATPQPAAPAAPAGSAAALMPARPMVVWAALASLTPNRFESVLAAYGPYTAIRPGLWLVQARMSPSALRNALSRRLRTDDALLVLQTPLDQVAWFNLAPTAERELRQLWGGQAG
jgi:hypothetical protein